MPKIKAKVSTEIPESTENNIRTKPRRTRLPKKIKEKEEARSKGKNLNIIESKNNTARKGIAKKAGYAFAGVFVLSLIAATGYFYYQWRQTKVNPQGVAKNEMAGIVADVSRLIELPVNEEPTMATVTSVEKLKDQPFFAKAQNGDKALIFSQSGKAILYRPSANKIIEVISLVGGGQLGAGAPATPTNQEPVVPEEKAQPTTENSTPVTEAPKAVNVVIYNGTTQKGLAKNISTKLAEISEAKVVKTGNAKGNFEKTVVIDLSGNNSDLVQKIAQTVGGEVGTLPENEAKPNAEILIIGGSDFKI